jgi:hypothetical protein
MDGLVPIHAQPGHGPEGRQPMSKPLQKKDFNGGKRTPCVHLDDKRKAVFLHHLATTGLKTKSAIMSGVSYQQVYERRKVDQEFAKLCEEAEGIFADSLIAEATRRSREGWDEAVYQKGYRVHEDCGACHGAGRAMEVYTDVSGEKSLRSTGPICEGCKGTGKGEPAVVRRYDSQLMSMLMKGYDHRFRERQETTVNVTGGILAVPMDPLSAADWHKQYSQQTAIDVTEESRELVPKLPEPKK